MNERVWTYNCNKESHVCLGEAVADQIVFAVEHLLEAVERLEERGNSCLVRRLRRREARLVHTICSGCSAYAMLLVIRGCDVLFTVSYTQVLISSISAR